MVQYLLKSASSDSYVFIYSFPKIENPLMAAPLAEKKFLLAILSSVSIIIIGSLLFPKTLETIFVKTFVWFVAVNLSRNIFDKSLFDVPDEVIVFIISFLLILLSSKSLNKFVVINWISEALFLFFGL